MTGSDDYPRYASHYVPRTRAGRLATATFIALLLLAEPPIVFAVANRIEPWLLGLPFLFGYLLFVYTALIAVLIVARRRGL
jgi:hypothetical protein